MERIRSPQGTATECNYFKKQKDGQNGSQPAEFSRPGPAMQNLQSDHRGHHHSGGSRVKDISETDALSHKLKLYGSKRAVAAYYHELGQHSEVKKNLDQFQEKRRNSGILVQPIQPKQTIEQQEYKVVDNPIKQGQGSSKKVRTFGSNRPIQPMIVVLGQQETTQSQKAPEINQSLTSSDMGLAGTQIINRKQIAKQKLIRSIQKVSPQITYIPEQGNIDSVTKNQSAYGIQNLENKPPQKEIERKVLNQTISTGPSVFSSAETPSYQKNDHSHESADGSFGLQPEKKQDTIIGNSKKRVGAKKVVGSYVKEISQKESEQLNKGDLPNKQQKGEIDREQQQLGEGIDSQNKQENIYKIDSGVEAIVQQPSDMTNSEGGQKGNPQQIADVPIQKRIPSIKSIPAHVEEVQQHLTQKLEVENSSSDTKIQDNPVPSEINQEEQTGNLYLLPSQKQKLPPSQPQTEQAQSNPVLLASKLENSQQKNLSDLKISQKGPGASLEQNSKKQTLVRPKGQENNKVYQKMCTSSKDHKDHPITQQTPSRTASTQLQAGIVSPCSDSSEHQGEQAKGCNDQGQTQTGQKVEIKQSAPTYENEHKDKYEAIPMPTQPPGLCDDVVKNASCPEPTITILKCASHDPEPAEQAQAPGSAGQRLKCSISEQTQVENGSKQNADSKLAPQSYLHVEVSEEEDDDTFQGATRPCATQKESKDNPVTVNQKSKGQFKGQMKAKHSQNQRMKGNKNDAQVASTPSVKLKASPAINNQQKNQENKQKSTKPYGINKFPKKATANHILLKSSSLKLKTEENTPIQGHSRQTETKNKLQAAHLVECRSNATQVEDANKLPSVVRLTAKASTVQVAKKMEKDPCNQKPILKERHDYLNLEIKEQKFRLNLSDRYERQLENINYRPFETGTAETDIKYKTFMSPKNNEPSSKIKVSPYLQPLLKTYGLVSINGKLQLDRRSKSKFSKENEKTQQQGYQNKSSKDSRKCPYTEKDLLRLKQQYEVIEKIEQQRSCSRTKGTKKKGKDSNPAY